jgi:hypothetical protein
VLESMSKLKNKVEGLLTDSIMDETSTLMEKALLMAKEKNKMKGAPPVRPFASEI